MNQSVCKMYNILSVFQRLSIYTSHAYFCINNLHSHRCINSTKVSINLGTSWNTHDQYHTKRESCFRNVT